MRTTGICLYSFNIVHGIRFFRWVNDGISPKYVYTTFSNSDKLVKILFSIYGYYYIARAFLDIFFGISKTSRW